MPELLMIIGLIAVLWFWRDNTLAREQATFAAKRACEQIGAQFLDGTVALAKLRLCRRETGTMALCRYYSFDFSLDGDQRRAGVVRMKALKIEDLMLDIDNPATLQ